MRLVEGELAHHQFRSLSSAIVKAKPRSKVIKRELRGQKMLRQGQPPQNGSLGGREP